MKTSSADSDRDLLLVLDVAMEAAMEAGKILAEWIKKDFGISHKGLTDIVTEVDILAEKKIIEVIKSEFPEDSIIAEESGISDDLSRRRWIIDPIDGTINFAHRLPFYSISIGFEEDSIIKAGVVYDPDRNETFSAVKGQGALLNGEKISVSSTSSLVESLLATGFSYDVRNIKRNNLSEFSSMIKKCQAIRRLGSASLDLCYVAAGRLDGFWELHLKPWDLAAASLIVKESGGIITLMDGGEFDIYKDNVIASNPHIYKDIVKALEV